jgi:SSS family solute:Na+ symporter
MNGRLGTPLDYAVIAGYFLLVLGFGSLFGRHNRSTRDFFFGGRRFSWWLVALSMVATLVGSYSFVKYSAKGYEHGFSSSMAYLNDWVWMPLFMFGWLPVLYFGRIRSIPEYCERRFDRRTRVAATVILLLYMVGYIGINFYTLGVALNRVVGWDVFPTAAAIAVATALYVTAGGQTAVIMTDLLQGLLLLAVGVAILVLGWLALGDGELGVGLARFWNDLDPEQRRALPGFNDPPSFNFVGIFWQDGFANSVFFYFMNQGVIMRFLAVRSLREGRKAAAATMLMLVPLAALAVSAGGWLGPAMVKAGLVSPDTASRDIFVAVAHALTEPGVFGLLLAALAAALMSSADSLINAVSAVFVNDIYQPFVRRRASDAHYLRVARITSLAAALVGIALVPLFMSFESIYRAHGAFTAAVTPAMVVAVLLGFLWRRFTAAAALCTLVGGTAASAASFVWPELVAPFAHGTAVEGGALQAYSYIRALYGLTVSAGIGVTVTLLTRAPEAEAVAGLVIGSLDRAKRRFKGGEPHEGQGESIVLRAREAPEAAGASASGASPASASPAPPTSEASASSASAASSASQKPPEPDAGWTEGAPVALAPVDLARVGAVPGDLLFVSHPSRWHGGLRGTHVRAATAADDADAGEVCLPQALLRRIKVAPGQRVRVERIL